MSEEIKTQDKNMWDKLIALEVAILEEHPPVVKGTVTQEDVDWINTYITLFNETHREGSNDNSDWVLVRKDILVETIHEVISFRDELLDLKYPEKPKHLSTFKDFPKYMKDLTSKETNEK